MGEGESLSRISMLRAILAIEKSPYWQFHLLEVPKEIPDLGPKNILAEFSVYLAKSIFFNDIPSHN